MGHDLIASYRLVYFQPDPEDGERVCVALLFSARGAFDMLYDPDFPKLKCFAPHIDRKLIRLYLDDMESRLNRGASDVEVSMRGRSPHLLMSQPRKAAWPLSDAARLRLMQRFLSKDRGVQSEKKEQSDQLKTSLKQLVWGVVGDNADVREDAKTQWVLGEKVPRIKSVALAVRRSNSVILIDGVDLRALTTKAALERVTKVAHTFWQYGRVRQEWWGERQALRRIGVVVNGAPNQSEAYKDAHDYALHEFQQEADLAVDTAHPDHILAFERALATG